MLHWILLALLLRVYIVLQKMADLVLFYWIVWQEKGMRTGSTHVEIGPRKGISLGPESSWKGCLDWRAGFEYRAFLHPASRK
jgi:hypothetical protein